ncbi:hypothetical protein [Antrihabitans spumae]|uniref:Uncharacterized protein n=1 Tax=Antrihabitans spumae TaxID=3373370 RepID=A0ABW7KCV2_9NOCA
MDKYDDITIDLIGGKALDRLLTLNDEILSWECGLQPRERVFCDTAQITEEHSDMGVPSGRFTLRASNPRSGEIFNLPVTPEIFPLRIRRWAGQKPRI